MLKASLIVVGGESADKEISLDLPAVIGRGRESAVQVQHSLVSRLHCELSEREGRLFVRDLHSLNGTYINNFRIQDEEPLMPNQLLTLGNITFRASYEIVRPGDLSRAENHPESNGSTKQPVAPAPRPAAGAAGSAPTQTPTVNLINWPNHSAAKSKTGGDAGGDSPNVLDDFEIGTNPQKSISVSALNHLPELGPQVSFVGQIDGAPGKNPVETDTDEISVQAPEGKKTAPVNPDDSALGSFVRKFAK